MAEPTTLSGMTETEPEPVGDLTAPWAEKLKARGLDPTPGEPEPSPLKETPEEARERHQRRLNAYAARWQAKVPEMYRTASLEDLDDLQHPPKVRGWLASGSLHLVLAGPVGTGKTHALYAVGNQALDRGLWVEAWAVGDLMDALRPGSSDHGAEERARSCHLLLLDDLPAKATDWEAERMTLLLDARVRNQRQTGLSTNITRAQIEEVWGGRFLDRLSYRLTACTFQGGSRRQGDW